MATHSSVLAWRIPMDSVADNSPCGRTESDTTEQLSMHACPILVLKTWVSRGP